MGNKEDWEELEKWQKEQDLKVEDIGLVYTKTFDEKKVKGTKIFSKILNFLTKTVLGLFITIFTIAAIIALLYVYSQFKDASPRDTEKHLKDVYRGEKFEIIEDYSNDIGKGLYILSPKSNKNIQFKAYNSGRTIRDDYSAQRLKYYIENCKDKKLLEGLNIEDKTEVSENIEFLKYSVYTGIDNYNQIEEKVTKLYKLAKYLNEQDEKMHESISIINWNKNYYFSISCNTTKTLEDEIYIAKYQYITSLKRYNDKELEKIGEEEIAKIFKPMSLILIINGKNMKLYNNEDARVFYGLEDRKYYMSGTDVIIKQIEQIEVLNVGTFSKQVKKIRYKDKVYKVKQSVSNGKSEDNVVYAGGTIEEFLEKFDSDIVYDYENEKVYVTIR